MLRLFFEVLGAYLLYQFVMMIFRSINTPASRPPQSNIKTETRKPDVNVEPRRKADKDDYIDYEEVK